MMVQSQSIETKKSKDADASASIEIIPQQTLYAKNYAPSIIMPIKMQPSLPIKMFQPNKNLWIAFDTRTKNPLYVMERLAANNNNSNNHKEKHKHNRSFSKNTTNANNANYDDDDYDSMPYESMPSRKNKKFYEETTLPPHFRSRNHHYRNSGYDRGHLAPAADFSSSSDEELNDTFVLTNISPQLPRFNRNIWLRLEEFVRNVAMAETETRRAGSNDDATMEEERETWVISGPLWLPSSTTDNTSAGGQGFRYSYDGIGKPPSLIAVPTHFFKVIAVVAKESKKNATSSTTINNRNHQNNDGADNNDVTVLRKFAAFVLPNSESKSEGGDGARGINNPKRNGFQLVNYIVRLTDLEAVAGMEFFPHLLGSYNGMDGDTNDSRGGNATVDTTPLRKEIADALTDHVRFNARSTQSGKKTKELTHKSSCSNDGALAVALVSEEEQWSKGRQRKVNQILRDNSPIPFQHLCSKNDACFKMHNV